MEEEEDSNIDAVFRSLESKEEISKETKKAVVSELELIQNASTVLDLFVGQYFKTLVNALSN